MPRRKIDINTLSGHNKPSEVKPMRDTGLWRMFCETGDPFCYLLYRSAVRERKIDRPDFPPAENLAFSGKVGSPEVRL